MESKNLLPVLVLAVSSACFANSNCDKPVNDFDGLYCMNKLFVEADKELNQNYAEVVRKLDVEGKSSLKESQLYWIKQRNEQCSRKEKGEFFVNMRCVTEETISRSDFLKSRLRECVSSGCRNSKL